MAEVVLHECDLRHLDEVLVGPLEHDPSAPLPRSVLVALQQLIPCDRLGAWEVEVATCRCLRSLELPQREAVRTRCVRDSLVVELVGPGGTSARLVLDRLSGCFSERDRLVLQLLRPRLAEVYLEGLAGAGQAHLLTVQERRILSLVATGRSNQQIADDLFVAVATVRKHLEHVYLKLGVSSRSAAVATAFPHVVASFRGAC